MTQLKIPHAATKIKDPHVPQLRPEVVKQINIKKKKIDPGQVKRSLSWFHQMYMRVDNHYYLSLISLM